MKGLLARLSAILLALPAYVFALTFGAAIVGTFFIASTILLIALLPSWPSDAAVARVTALMWLGLAEALIVCLVVVSWAMGKLDTFSFQAGIVSAAVDFQGDDAVPGVPNNPPPVPPPITPLQDPPF